MLPPIVITGQVVSNIRDDLRGTLLPLLDLCSELAVKIRERVHGAGKAGDGSPWSPYKSKRRLPKKGDRFYWTRPGEETPELHRLVLAKSGPRTGRAAYPSYALYREAIGKPLPSAKTFVMTHELADSITVTAIQPALVRIEYNRKLRRSPYFRAKSGKPYTNQKVAQFAFRSEHMSPMQPSPEELAWFQRELAARVPAAVLKTINLAGQAARAVASARRLTNRANRLLTAGVPVR